MTSLIGFLIIGALAGFLAGKMMKGEGFGLWGNLGVGILGAIIGGFVIGLLGFKAGGLIAQLISAFAGAVILLWVVDRVRK